MPPAETPDGSPRPAAPTEPPAAPGEDLGPAAGPDATPDADAPGAAAPSAESEPDGTEPGANASPLLVPPDEEPELGAYLREQFEAVPKAAKLAVGVLLVALAALWAVGLILDSRETLTDEDAERRAEIERLEWSASLRQAPTPLTDSLVTGELQPGDAETSDGSYADYYAFEAPDSVAYSVVVTSADFAPDLAVRLPDGRTLAASNLLRTETRAEITGLRGPGRFDIAVRSMVPEATGAYDLSVQRVAPIDTVYVDDAPVADSLGGGFLRMGRYERPFGIVADSENPVVLRVVSEDFVPRLSLLGPNGEVTGSWRTAQTISRGDSVHAAVIRFQPGWELAPYRLLVTSAEPGETGTFALEATSLIPQRISTNGSLTRTLSEDSWVEDGRYVDYYVFRGQSGVITTIEAQSETFAPALRLWRSVRREQKEVASALNATGTQRAALEQKLETDEYILEVTSGGTPEDSARAYGGDYALVLKTIRPEPPPPSPPRSSDDDDGPPPAPGSTETKVFPVSASGRGTAGSNTFEVRVTHATVSYPAGSRTRIQLSVSVESVNYSGTWAPWSSFVSGGYVTDDQGRRYTPSGGSSPSGAEAEPGTVRRGTVVFTSPGVNTNIRRLTYTAPLGGASVRLGFSVP